MVDYLAECLKEPVPREWSFPESEYRDRLSRVRAAMDRAGIDVLLVHSVVDNCYLCGYQSLWPEAYACLVVPGHGEPFMQVGEIEGALAVLHGYVTDIVTFSWVGSEVAPSQLAGFLADRGFGRRRIGVQMGSIEMGLRGPLDARACLRVEGIAPGSRVRGRHPPHVRHPGSEVAGGDRTSSAGRGDHREGNQGRDRGRGSGIIGKPALRPRRPGDDRRRLRALFHRSHHQRGAPLRVVSHHPSNGSRCARAITCCSSSGVAGTATPPP